MKTVTISFPLAALGAVIIIMAVAALAIALVVPAIAPILNPPTAPAPTIAGDWLWFNNELVTCHEDGTCVNHTSSIVGVWRYDPEARTYSIEWHPEGCVDVLALSEDGRYLDGTNDDGIKVWADRAD